MVLIRLQIQNFLSYGEPPQEIDLRGVHMAALVGNNGAGKSALLDAITWALFGKARSNRNSELIRKGATEMSVTLEFDVDGQIYRVRRRFSRKTGTHTASLEQNIDGNRWRSIVTESKVTVVEREIQKLLRMNYDTFINTVFMPQGQSGRFMDLSPAERRDLLAQVLGLDVCEKLAEKAREQVRALSGQINEGQRRMSQIENEIALIPQVVKEFENKQREREHTKQMLQKTEEEIKQVQKKREDLLTQKAQLDLLSDEAKLHKQQIDDARGKIQEFEGRLEQWNKVLAKEQQITEAMKKFLQAQEAERLLSEKASQLRELEQKRHQLEQLISKAQSELENRLKAVERDEAHISKRLKELQELIGKKGEVIRRLDELQKAREALKEWDEKQRQWSALQQQRTQLEREIAEEREKWAQLEGKLQQAQTQHESKIAQKPQVEQRLKQLEESKEKLKEWQQFLDTARKKKEQIAGQITMLVTRREQLQKAMDETREKLHLLAEHAGEPKCPLCETTLTPQKLASLRKKLTKEVEQYEAEIAETERETERLQKDLEQLNSQIEKAEVALRQLPELERQIGEIQQRLLEIADAEKELQKLKADRELLQLRKSEAERQWQEQRQELETKERSLGYDPDAHQRWHQKVESLARFESEIERIRQAEEEALSLQEQLGKLKTEIDSIKQKLSTGDFAHGERRELERVEEDIRNLGYDETKHQQLRDWIQKNQHIHQWWQQLQTAKEEVPKLQRWIEEAKQRISESEKRLREIDLQTKKLQERISQLPEIEEQLDELQGRRKARENELQRLNEELGALRQKLEELKHREQEKWELEQRLAQLSMEKQDYELLAEAFGRNGIPKMVLRNAVQWLEWEANRLLALLTNGRMHLRFELETPTESGSQKETLAIIVSDELGDRAYELYSGGERFRIDFAVRVALARLLSYRAGAPLRTLIIDEGFGSQDKEGLEAIIEAIQTVSKEFARILIVTHLEEFREHFPALIEVTKEGSGSKCRLIVRGQQEVSSTAY
ncbi:MAG: SMC family ATPase [Armatimonadetes bacterium]|nr:SMC family ATPase [Armatimonadota bacterium]